jgi:hypothetical protein
MNHPSPLLQLSLGSLLLLVMTTIASCGATGETLVANGLLTGEPCAPPCWQGLIPGVSTEEEVDRFLRTSQYVDTHTVSEDGYESGVAISWQRRGQGGAWNIFDLQDGVLQVIRMYCDSEVVLEQLIDRYGSPDMFEAGLVMLDGPVHTKVDLFYRGLGMMVELRLPGDRPVLSPDTRVIKVQYFEPGALEEVLATIWLKKGVSLADLELRWLEDWRQWQGYGPVELE